MLNLVVDPITSSVSCSRSASISLRGVRSAFYRSMQDDHDDTVRVTLAESAARTEGVYSQEETTLIDTCGNLKVAQLQAALDNGREYTVSEEHDPSLLLLQGTHQLGAATLFTEPIVYMMATEVGGVHLEL